MPSPLAAAGARSILDAATALFADEGFESVSVSAIAARAGVCKANVFHHYESKDALYLAVMKQASAEHADYAEALYQTPGSSAEKVRKLIQFELRHMFENEERTRLVLREASTGGNDRARKLARQVFQRNFTAVVNIFEQGRAQGEFRAEIDPAAATMLLGGATHFFFTCRDSLREFRGIGDAQTRAIYAGRVADLILSGVATPAGSTTPSAPAAPYAETCAAPAHGARRRRAEETQ